VELRLLEREALEDVLRLSKGMSYKNAVADLEMGGGKSVIIGDSRTQKSPELFHAFGRAVDTLGGRYYAAEDVGVSVSDIAEARKATEYVLGLSDGPEASGDPSPVTAEGVFRSTLTVARRLWKQDDLTGLTVALQGIGHVGGYLADKLHAAGAKLVMTDVNTALLAEVAARTGAEIVAPDAIYDVKADIYAPCALGATLNPQTLDRITAKAVVGAAAIVIPGARSEPRDPAARVSAKLSGAPGARTASTFVFRRRRGAAGSRPSPG
jgi:leucine dehydrogenase